MSSTKPLLDFYKGILSFSSMRVNNLGYVECVLADQSAMCMIGGKSLIFPTEERLQRFDFEKELIFHPMTESIVRGESEIQEKLRDSFTSKVNISIYFLFLKLLEIAKDPARHITLDPDQSELLAIVKNVDQKCYDNFTSLGLEVLKGRMVDYRFVDMRLKRSGRYKDKQVDKLGVVFFPFYEKLQLKDVTKLRVRDIEVIKSLYNYVFNMKEEDAYNRPCHGTGTPPYLTSYLYAGAALVTPINDMYERFRNTFTGEEAELMSSYTFDLDWFDTLTNIESLLPIVSRISGGQANMGKIEEKETAAPKAQAASVPALVKPQEQPVLSKQAQSLVPVSTTPINPVVSAPNPLGFVAQQNPMFGGMAPQAPAMGQPNTGRPSALSSSLRASGIAPVTMPMNNPFLQQQIRQQAQVERVPIWAKPTNPVGDVQVRNINGFGGMPQMNNMGGMNNMGNPAMGMGGNMPQMGMVGNGMQPSNPLMGMNNPAMGMMGNVNNNIPPWQ